MSINFKKYIDAKSTHYIANSGSDENKKYTGGEAGDQTGHEWELKAFYKRPWTVVLRYPNQTVALKIAELGIAAALNDKIGYDQGERGTYWKQLKAANFDPSKITTACEEDCTAGVSSNVKAAGYIYGIQALKDIPICTSRNMRQEFAKAGFIALTQSKYLNSGNYLLPGDILLYENHHAATNITLGKDVKDYWNPQPKPVEPDEPETPEESDEPARQEVQPPFVTITGNSVFARKGPSTDYGSIGVAHKGDKLHYFGYDYPDNGWHLVEYEKQTGWVSNKYGKVEN